MTCDVTISYMMSRISSWELTVCFLAIISGLYADSEVTINVGMSYYNLYENAYIIHL